MSIVSKLDCLQNKTSHDKHVLFLLKPFKFYSTTTRHTRHTKQKLDNYNHMGESNLMHLSLQKKTGQTI